MKVDVAVGGNSYGTMTENLLPGVLFDSTEDGDSDHNATLIDGNAHSIRNNSSGIKEVSDADGAVGNMVQLNFNSNWNGADNGDANGWMSAVDNVRFVPWLRVMPMPMAWLTWLICSRCLVVRSSMRASMALPGNRATSTLTTSSTRAICSRCWLSSKATSQRSVCVGSWRFERRGCRCDCELRNGRSHC